MPTARVSPAPATRTSSKVAYRANNAPVPSNGVLPSGGGPIGLGGNSNSSNPANGRSLHRDGHGRSASGPSNKGSYFKLGQRLLGHHHHHQKQRSKDIGQGHDPYDGSRESHQNKKKNPMPIKFQSISDSDHSTSSGSSNRISLGNSASPDNDFGSNGVRSGWSNWATNDHHPRTQGFQTSSCVGGGGGGVSSLFGFSSLTPYQKVLKSLSEDERWQREITLGRRMGFYRFRGEIGSGNFSQVKVALHTLTKEKVAVKILDKSKLDGKTHRMLSREISSMERLHHPNLVRLFEVIETFSKIYLVIEFASGGELFQKISTEGRFDEASAKPLFAQIVSAIDHMHQHHIIHRDIKAENVFFADNSKTVKVGDFGFSTEITGRQELLNTFCGSPPYAAPELFSDADSGYMGCLVDLWSLGILLYFMVTATMPFRAATVSALKKLILEGVYATPEFLSEDSLYIIRGLLRREATKRLSIKQLRESPWLREQSFPVSLPKYKTTQGIKETHPRQRQDALGSKKEEEEEEEEQEPTTLMVPPESTTVAPVVTQEGEDELLLLLQNSTSLGSKSRATAEKKKATDQALELSKDELEAYQQLDALGICEAMINDARDRGVRSNIIGTYRILLHRIVSRRYAAGRKHGRSPNSSAGTTRTTSSNGSSATGARRPGSKSQNQSKSCHKEQDKCRKVGEGTRNQKSNEDSNKVIKSPKKSSKSILSSHRLEEKDEEGGSVNNNTLPSSKCSERKATNGALNSSTMKGCAALTTTSSPRNCDKANLGSTGDDDGSCPKTRPCDCPCRPLSNNYFCEKTSSSSSRKQKGDKKKKRWKSSKWADACALL